MASCSFRSARLGAKSCQIAGKPRELGLCILPDQPLTESKAYGFSGCIIFADYVYKADSRFPNAFPPGMSQTKVEMHTMPEKVFHCRACDKAVMDFCKERKSKD